jgi:pimeloyl-ACP methyl ester carboxylesterase
MLGRAYPRQQIAPFGAVTALRHGRRARVRSRLRRLIRQHPCAHAIKGPPVVVLHGFPETSYAWRYQIEALKTRYRLILPDLRGYGATDKAPTGYDKRTMANDIRAASHSDAVALRSGLAC